MFRSCVSSVVILSLVATQLAAVPHAHPGMSLDEQQRHAATPHIHWSWLHHAHEHSHDGHRHGHDHRSEPAEQSPSEDGLSDASHDATAIYFPEVATAALPSQPPLTTVSPPVVASLEVYGAMLRPVGGRIDRMRPPDKVLDGSDIYLTLRVLRI